MKNNIQFVANISDAVLKTLEAETAQNPIGAEQSAQLNSNKPTVVKKWSGLTQGTDHRPIGIIHYFTSMGQYIKSVMKTTLQSSVIPPTLKVTAVLLMPTIGCQPNTSLKYSSSTSWIQTSWILVLKLSGLKSRSATTNACPR